MLKKIIGTLCILLFNTLGYGKGIDKSPSFSQEIDLVIKESLQKFNVPGLAIGVIADHQVILLRGYGDRNVEVGLPVTENTLFPIASCTKAFTTMILAQLVDEKLIAWDDLVISYIPEFRLLDEQISSEITLRDIAAHRTGIPRHDAMWVCKKMSRSDVLSRLQYLEPVCQLRTQWHYSNIMYSVAGILIERVTGQSWEEAVYSRILSPLKMSSSNLCIEQLQKNSDFSLPYAEINGVIEPQSFRRLDGVEPGGALNSNIVDMLKWVRMQLPKGHNLLVKKDSLEEMHTLQIPFSAKDHKDLGISPLGYGLGWCIATYKDYSLIHHGGSIDGFNSEVSLLPQKNIGIVILSNSSTDGRYAVASIRNTILDRLLGICDTNWIDFAETKRTQIKELLKAEDNKEFRKAPAALLDYVGHYEHPAYGIVQISLLNNQLKASYGDMVIDLHYSHDNTFQGQLRQLLVFGIKQMTDFRFSMSPDGLINEVHISFEPDAKPLPFMRLRS